MRTYFWGGEFELRLSSDCKLSQKIMRELKPKKTEDEVWSSVTKLAKLIEGEVTIWDSSRLLIVCSLKNKIFTIEKDFSEQRKPAEEEMDRYYTRRKSIRGVRNPADLSQWILKPHVETLKEKGRKK